MVFLGSQSMVVAFTATLISIVCLFISLRGYRNLSTVSKQAAKQAPSMNIPQLIGFIGVWLSTLVLTLCVVLLLVAFLGDDNSIYYVARQRSNSVSDLAVLFKISGLWAGREGSLLFWAWLISVFNSIVALKAWRDFRRNSMPTEVLDTGEAAPVAKPKAFPAQRLALDSAALAVSQLVLVAFLAILVFDEGNRPFVALPSEYLDAAGALTGNAALWSMNTLLEHWAMAIHPPTLFIGYAGMTIPFAYAIAALILNDASPTWVERSGRYTLISWLFLGIGIGLGAVWAYVVLGWGGYWGWDPVENASLLPWLVCVALVHSMTIYRQRGTFKGWTIMCACLTFSFVIVSTFITRSGIVASVHAFEANQVSLVLFGILIVVPLLAGIIGLIIRRSTFFGSSNESDEAESLMSKDVFFYLNNVVMIVCAFVLLYMTLASALPSWLPFGGQSLGATSYNFVARPIGIIYCLILAIGPLLGWRKTDKAEFLKNARIPALFALALFAVLCIYFATTLMPIYMQTLGYGGVNAEALLENGPFWYYALLTILGFLAASLLIFNALFMLVRAITKRNLRVQWLGGFLAHLSLGVIVIGLIGSSMYVFDRSGYLEYDLETDTVAQDIVIRDYTLSYVSNDIEEVENGDKFYSVTFDVEKNGRYLGQVTPSIQLIHTTQQQQLNAAVISSPTEDLFVVYKGVNDFGSFSLDIRINPLISFVWVGFVLMMLGTAVAAFGRRR